MSDRWDIFCRVVDNFGDVGVSWRLARQVAREHRKDVRLWIDDLTVLKKLRPELDMSLDTQRINGVRVAQAEDEFDADGIADVVVETFGCDPPDAYLHAMAERSPKPRWINLEYLSAEDWVEGTHALPSPNPRLPLTKHFFFPGFTPKTGGLLREESLLRRRDEFQRDTGAQTAFWKSLAGRAPPEGALKVSLFSYAEAPVESLARACLRHPGPVWLVAPEGYAASALASLPVGHSAVEIFTIPFLAQDRYDELLWACDVNFVRGEDSFVRAQWAGRPFVWHIYPQGEGAHWVKLSAFLNRYNQGLDPSAAVAVTTLWDAWNGGGEVPDVATDLAAAWQAFVDRRQPLSAHARAWSRSLQLQPELASELVRFAAQLVKITG